MTSGVKAKRARDLARIQEHHGRMVRIQASEEPSIAKSKPKSKKKKKKSSTSAKDIDEDEEDDQDELVDQIQRVSKVSKSKPIPKKTFKDLATTAKFLSEMDSVVDLNEFLHSNGLQADEDVATFAENCGSIARLLRNRSEGSKDDTPTNDPGEVENFDMMYMLRDGQRGMQLLAPVEIFDASQPIKDRVIGFVRHAGKYWPLMFAISGKKELVCGHPKLLDSNLWTALAFTWGNDFGHMFRTNGWEAQQNEPKGTAFASHVEPKLMLWLACQEWTKLTRRTLSLDKQIKMLFELQDLEQKITVEIVQDRLPCDCCRKFGKRLEKFTGYKLRFKFVICPNVGVMESVVSKHGARVNQLPNVQRVVDVDEQDDDEQSGQRTYATHFSQKRFEVVIHNGPKTPPKTPKQLKSRQRRADTPEEEPPKVSNYTVTQRELIRSFSCRTTSSVPKDGVVIEIDSDESDGSDYQPPSRSSRSVLKRKSTQVFTPPNASNSGLPTPSSSLFPESAYRKAAEVKNAHRKRKNDMADISPSGGKKACHTRFS